MMVRERVTNANSHILRQCREQIGLKLAGVEKKVPKIAEIEKGELNPTFRQLDTLAKLYEVPRWVFVSEALPEQYQFKKAVSAFRQFAQSREELFSDHKIRSLIAKIERLRNLILELRNDMGEPIAPFNPPELQNNAPADSTAKKVRKWLDTIKAESFDFHEWKEKVEGKGVFVFMTSKYRSWSHIDRNLFRGLAIYHSTLPIIVINDSDARKAQSFTLFHELGHLLRQENALDDWEDHRQVEEWCDELAGNVLMPVDPFQRVAGDTEDLEDVKRIARKFRVSDYACLVRLRRLGMIDQHTYINLEAQLEDNYAKLRERLRRAEGGPPRDRSKEALDQYGRIYARTLFQAYHDKEIGLHKLCRLFDLKRAHHALKLEQDL